MLYIHYALLCIVFCTVPTLADLSTTHVSSVRHDGATSVAIEAGSDQGLQTGASVTLLRAGEEIIHPISKKPIIFEAPIPTDINDYLVTYRQN